MGDRIEEFVNAIRTQDTHKRLKLAIELGSYLKSAIANVRDFEPLLDGLIIWAGSSNFKVGILGQCSYHIKTSQFYIVNN